MGKKRCHTTTQGHTAETCVTFAEGASGLQNNESALERGDWCLLRGHHTWHLWEVATQSSGWVSGLELQRTAYWKKPLTLEGVLQVFCQSRLTRKVQGLESQQYQVHRASSGQRCRDPGVWSHTQPASQSLPPALGAGIWHPGLSVPSPSSPEGPSPCPHLQGGTFSSTDLFCSVLSHQDLFL